MTPEEERELLLRIQARQHEFGVLFDYYYKPIFGYLYRRTADYDLARDMAAETFLKAFLKIGQFTWKGFSISSWLYRIATNEANQYFRRQKYRPLRLESILNPEILPQADSETERQELEQELRDHQDFLAVRHSLTKLDIRFQEVIALRYFESKTTLEISEILAKPEGTIRSLLSRGLERLRKLVIR